MNENPVVIIGAGPTGVTAAGLLARHGVPVLVFDREPDIVPIPRAIHLDDEILRVFHETCFGEAATAATAPIRGMLLVDRERRTLVSFAREGLGPHGFSRSSGFDQPELESAMRAPLVRHPLVTLRTGMSVEAVEPRPGGRLRVTVRRVSDGTIETLETCAVLGCDGARSRTRTFVGTDFEDLGFEARWLVVDVATPAPLGLYGGCLQVADPERPTTYFHTGGERHRWEIMLMSGETAEEMTREARVRDLLRPWLGPATDTATLRRRAVYTFHSLVARRFRRGRVFLLGDAAHQTPPFIGQGLAAGARDAANLCWKLAAVLQGRASEELLDTYQAERRPHVRSSIQTAVLLGRTMRTSLGGRYKNAVLKRIGDVRRVHDLLVRRAFPDLVPGPMVRPRGSGPAGGHVPRAPVEADGRTTHIDDVLGDGFCLLFKAGAQPDGRPLFRLRRIGESGGDHLIVDRDAVLAAWIAELGAEAALVRPDRVVMASGRAEAAPRWIEALTLACGWQHR